MVVVVSLLIIIIRFCSSQQREHQRGSTKPNSCHANGGFVQFRAATSSHETIRNLCFSLPLVSFPHYYDWSKKNRTQMEMLRLLQTKNVDMEE